MKIKSFYTITLFLILLISITCMNGSAAVIMKITEESPSAVTIQDFTDQVVSIKKPVERVVILDGHQQLTSALQALGKYQTIVGIDSDTAKEKNLFPNIDKIPLVGTKKELDIEKILSLNPDVVFDVGSYPGDEVEKMKTAGLTVVTISLFPTNEEGFTPTEENTRILGSIMGSRDKADEFVDWRSHYLDIIEKRVKNLSESEKPSSLYTYKWKDNSIFGAGSKNRFHYVLKYIGASDINSEISGDWAEVDLEHVIKANPSYIIFEDMNHNSGYGITNTSSLNDSIRSLSDLPGFSNVDAVKNKKIYSLPMSLLSGDTWLAAIYLAPVLHPELFKDFDSQKIHQEYIDKFMKVKTDVKKDGTFLYPRA